MLKKKKKKKKKRFLANLVCRFVNYRHVIISRAVDESNYTSGWMVSYVLKGHCHAIWQLYKKLDGVFASIEFQNYRPATWFCY